MQRAQSKRRWMVAAILASFLVAAGYACDGDGDDRDGARDGGADGGEPLEDYRATIRWTSHGIPHVLADDLAGAAFGLAYASARDIVCVFADQIVLVRSERARYFGPGQGDANINTDFAILNGRVYAEAEDALPALSGEQKEAVEAYAAGYNHFLEQTGIDNLPADCAGADWVKPITPTDLLAYYYWVTLFASLHPLLGFLSDAAPPAASGGTSLLQTRPPDLPDLRETALASNGWAIGKDRTETGQGMLVANPHFPWEGNRRFYEIHITVPGLANVYGVSLTGAAAVVIGFNEQVAWTHTVTTANHFTFYSLRLSPDDPTKYIYDDEVRDITSSDFTIDVRQSDGSLQPMTRTMYRSHYGPMVNIVWDQTQAYTLRDANERNFEIVDQFLAMDRAKNMREFKQVNEQFHGIPWVNTMATSTDGMAVYFDASRTPNLSKEAIDGYLNALESDFMAQTMREMGAVLLDGSDSVNEWIESDGPGKGIVPFNESPQLERADFVCNANDSHWLTNPAQPLEGYSPLFGDERTPRSPRTRMNLMMLTETGEGAASGADGKFSFEELKNTVFNNRASLAELLRDQVTGRCDGVSSVDLEGQTVSIGDACSALQAWDARLDNDSVGAVVWREFLASFENDLTDAGALFQQGFDPDDPVATPHTLTPAPADGPDPVLEALARAVVTLQAAGFSADTTLGEAQFTQKGEQRIPIHGGTNTEGAFNIIGFNPDSGTLLPEIVEGGAPVAANTDLTAQGYPVNNGSSFVMVLEFTDDGPRAEALLTYSQSPDRDSPFFADQTLRFSDKKWRPILFTEEDINADPNLETVEVQAPRPR